LGIIFCIGSEIEARGIAVAEKKELIVAGMTCDHCAAAVKREVEKVPGVTAADVNLETGRLEVSGANLDEERVEEAVVAAGYTVTGPA
jgi:copper chaperone CopZ